MRAIIYIALFSLLFSACKLVNAKQFPDTLNNKITTDYYRFPGTKVFIIAPLGYDVDPDAHIGIYKEKAGKIGVDEQVGINYYRVEKTITKQNFQDKGFKVKEFKNISVNGFKGKYSSLGLRDGLNKYTMIFGDSSFTATVEAIYPAMYLTTKQELKTALASIVYEKYRVFKPRTPIAFTLDDTKGSLKQTRQQASTRYYYMLPDGKNADSVGNISFTAMEVEEDPLLNEKSIANAVFEKLNENGMSSYAGISTSSASIGGYATYEMTQEAIINGVKCYVYECVVSDDRKVVIMEGIAKTDLAKADNEFKILSHTVHL